MTTIYFVRHAEADNSNRDGRNRSLTEKGMKDRALVTKFLLGKNISAVISSPRVFLLDNGGNIANAMLITGTSSGIAIPSVTMVAQYGNI